MTEPLRPSVVLASANRAALLENIVEGMLSQTQKPHLVLSVPTGASLPSKVPTAADVAFASGLSAQRNAGLRLAPLDAIVFFFDDDAVVRNDYIEQALTVFRDNPDVIALTGRVLLDGATGDEISREDAEAALATSTMESLTGTIRPWSELYGCNFAYRRSAAPDEWFDERLPLYSWLEDHDFARRLLRRGRIVKADDCVIVHRGVKSGGRAAHTRLGYSQMMNPLYLHKKGSFPFWLTIREIIPRCGKNLVYSFAGPEHTWRRERLRGNLHALRDAIAGHLDPERMLDH